MVTTNPDLVQTMELWNMMESKFVMKSMEAMMPSVKINKKLYIPMLDTIFTRENLGSLPVFTEQQRTAGGSAWKKRLLRDGSSEQ